MARRKVLYGYSMENGQIVICEEEAQLVRRIFRELTEGKSGSGIGTQLFKEGIPYFEEKASKSANKVCCILRDRRYAGADGYPPIVEADVFEKAQRGRLPCVSQKGRGKMEQPAHEAETETVYTPHKGIAVMEAELREIVTCNADCETVRQKILELAAAKYACIHKTPV